MDSPSRMDTHILVCHSVLCMWHNYRNWQFHRKLRKQIVRNIVNKRNKRKRNDFGLGTFKLRVCRSIGHCRVPKSFSVKTRLKVETFLVKMSFMEGKIIFKSIALHLGRFPFVRTDRPDPCRRNDFPARSVKSQMVCKKEMVFQWTLWKNRFHLLTDWSAMVRPASSDKWKAPLASLWNRVLR